MALWSVDVTNGLLPTPLAYLLWFVLAVVIVLSLTRAYTTIQFRTSIRQHSSPNSDVKHLCEPPQIPYDLPVLGNALSFLTPTPGKFWDRLTHTLPSNTGVCSLLLGGRKAHIVYGTDSVHALFRAKDVTRDVINFQVLENGFGASHSDVVKYVNDPTGKTEKINHDFLLKTERVNELTATFAQMLREELARDAATVDSLGEVNLYEWLRNHMFNASTTAFMGRGLLKLYPGLCEDFYKFDNEFMAMFFGVSSFLSPGASRRRTRILNTIAGWIQKMYEESGGQPMDPLNDTVWEPLFGSRANRARQNFYAEQDLSFKGRASYDLGFIFALSSNAVPATGWMLLHILDPNGEPDLLKRVLAEIESAVREDGSLDVSKLVSLPLLQSIYHEVLRLHTDVLVSRDLGNDLMLPTGDPDGRQVLLKKGGIVFAPAWIAHHDESSWNGDVPSHTFWADRFVKLDEQSGKHMFSTAGSAGKHFPFGGGRTICPGRVFAKQEVIVALAQVLLDFEFDVVSFIDGKGKSVDQFPVPRKAFPGSAILVMEGDMRVKLRAKNA